MPTMLKLEEFGSLVWSAFGEPPYLVGSALETTKYRDVDVRLILSDERYEAEGYGKPGDEHQNGKWRAMVLAFSSLGREMTGLPIDFQIQQASHANKVFERMDNPEKRTGSDNTRSCLGLVPWRMKDNKAI